MRAAPWVKRIDLLTGVSTSMALDPHKPLNTSINETESFTESYQFDGQSWFHVAKKNRVWAMHGTVASSGSALYVFMEYPEARHPQLEAELLRSPDALGPYADWLEEQGDPYAASLKPALLKERGPAGMWFLEGLDRSGHLRFMLKDALVREVHVETLRSEHLLMTLHRLVHLRAAMTLEKVSISARTLEGSGNVGAWSMWGDIQWPSSMRTLELPVDSVGLVAVEKRAATRVKGIRVLKAPAVS
ncbi:MAG: hypothetical protein QM817_23165 [Archangium sp.]